MGLGPASLYNAFGTKRALFLRALERYVEQGLRPRIAKLAAMPDAMDAIAAFLGDIVVRSLADPQRRGCLLVNTALEVAPHDTGIGAYVAARLAEVEEFLAGRVRAAQAQGRVDPARDAADAARMLLATVMGLRVFARVRPEPDLLHGVARQALATLDPPLEIAR
jgi:TetR/AcrR family transcriptional repressor of nem operon